MQIHVLRGNWQEIVEGLTRIPGKVREAIVFVEEPVTAAPPPQSKAILAEMRPSMADSADDSREAVSTRGR